MVLLFSFAALIFSFISYYLGIEFFNSNLFYLDYLVFISVSAFVVIGGYQLFFWVEYNNYKRKLRCFNIKPDNYIPHWPWVVWIYGFSYYLIFFFLIMSLDSLYQGLYYIFGAIILLIIHCLIFYFFPSSVPKSWRKYKKDTKSKKFLAFIQDIDTGRNCMPSMHMSVATYVSLLLFPVFSYYSYLIILIVALSCLFVKQHQILDIPAGILLGWLVYFILF